MSYTVYVWEYPVPRPEAPDDMDAIIEGMHTYRAPPSPRFRALARAMTQRYPDWGDDESIPAVWLDSPTTGEIPGPHWTIGIVTGYLNDAGPFLFETAQKLGLCLYDFQSGEICLPDPSWWTPGFRAHDSALGGKLGGLDVSLVEEIAATQLMEPLAAAGFHRVGYQFVRPIEDGWHSVRCGLVPTGDGEGVQLLVYFGVHLRTVIDALVAVPQDFRPTEAWGGWGFSLNHLMPGAGPDAVPEIPVRSMLNVRDELHNALPLVRNKAIPLLERARDLQSLNQLLGEQRDHGGMWTSPVVRIIVAILAEPEKIVTHTEGLKLMIRRAGMPPAERTAMEGLVAYVRRQAPGVIGTEADWGRKP